MENINETTKRTCINYDINNQLIMGKRKDIVLLEIEIKKLKGESIIYDNQEECSLRIVANLHNRKIINIIAILIK